MVFFLTATNESANKPEVSENPSIVKYCVLFGLLLFLIAITFFVFKLKKKEKVVLTPYKIPVVNKFKLGKNPKTEKEEKPKQVDLESAEKPKTEGKIQGTNTSNPDTKVPEDSAPKPEEKSNTEGKDQEAKSLNLDEKGDSKTDNNSEHVENQQAEKEEKPKQVDLESAEKPKTEGTIQGTNTSNPDTKVPEDSAPKPEEKSNTEPKRVEPPVKNEAPEPESEPEPEPEPEPAAEKDLNNPEGAGELAKETEEELKLRLFKKIEEDLEKFELPLSEDTKKEIQQRFQIVVSVLIKMKFTVDKIKAFDLQSHLHLDISGPFEKKKISYKLFLSISEKDLKGKCQFWENIDTEYQKLVKEIKIEKESQAEFEKELETMISTIKKGYDEYSKLETLYLNKLETLFSDALNPFFTAEGLKDVRAHTEEGPKSKKIFIDLQKNKIMLENAVIQILNFLLRRQRLTEEDFQTKEIKTTEIQYKVINNEKPGLQIGCTLTQDFTQDFTQDLTQDKKKRNKILLQIFNRDGQAWMHISNNWSRYRCDYPLDTPLIFEEVKPENLIPNKESET